MMWRFDGADWDKMAEVMQKSGCGNVGPAFLWQGHWVLGFVTWLLIIVLLIALIRWVWKKGTVR